MTVSAWQYGSINDDTVYDLTVVGAGIAGISAAYWFRHYNPKASILVLDRGDIGSGATGRNAGFVTCGSVGHFQKLCEKWGDQRAAEIWAFSEKNHELMVAHAELTEKSHDYLQGGSISLGISESTLNDLKSTANKMKSLGIRVDILSESDVEASHGLHGYSGGAFYPLDGRVHPLKVATTLFEKSKAVKIPLCEVYKIEHLNEQNLTFTNKGVFKSKFTVLALNAYSRQFHHPKIPNVMPHRGQVLVTTALKCKILPVCYVRETLTYFRQLPGGEILIGGFRNIDQETEATLEDGLNLKIQSALEGHLAQHLKLDRPLKIEHRWSGVMGFTEDERPKVVELERNSLFIGGFNGHGMGLAFHLAKKAIEHLDGKELPSFLV